MLLIFDNFRIMHSDHVYDVRMRMRKKELAQSRRVMESDGRGAARVVGDVVRMSADSRSG